MEFQLHLRSQVMKACRMRVHMSRKHLMANFACHIGECNFNAPYASGIVAHVDQEHRQEDMQLISALWNYEQSNYSELWFQTFVSVFVDVSPI